MSNMSKWISVKERMPEEYKIVRLLCEEHGKHTIGYMAHYNEENIQGTYFFYEDDSMTKKTIIPTHWKELYDQSVPPIKKDSSANNEETNKLIKMNQQLLLILGFATAMIKFPDNSKADDEYWLKYEWFKKAVENVVYLGKPIPKMP